MSINLSALFATELAKKITIPSKQSISFEKGYDVKGINKFKNSQVLAKKVLQPETVVQLNSTPFKIDIDEYKNPHSTDNPTGDYKAAYRLSRLADAIPELSTYYSSSLNSTEKIWGNIVHYATTQSGYTQKILSEAQLKYSLSKLAGMGGVPEDWLPVYTNPSNWYDIVEDENNLIKMEIDTVNGETSNNDFLILNGGKAVSLNTINKDNNQSPTSFNPNTTITKIRIDVLRVDFLRPWLNFEIFNLQDWKIDGLHKGYYSSGRLNINDGIIPLIPKSMLIGTKISLDGNFHKNDIDMMADYMTMANNLSIGPFLLGTNKQCFDIKKKNLNTTITSNVKQVVGYISQLVPLSPHA